MPPDLGSAMRADLLGAEMDSYSADGDEQSVSEDGADDACSDPNSQSIDSSATATRSGCLGGAGKYLAKRPAGFDDSEDEAADYFMEQSFCEAPLDMSQAPELDEDVCDVNDEMFHAAEFPDHLDGESQGVSGLVSEKSKRCDDGVATVS